VAAALGLPVRSFSRKVLALCVCLTALSVAVSGLVGFVGLVAPHAARSLVGGAHERLVPAACLLGALFVLLSDTVARTAFAPREVPVGLITALVGGPCFLLLLSRRAL
jgi:iron complex transport system permease protein